MKQPVYEGKITDVQGILVGQTQNEQALTGVTVVLAGKDGATVAVDVRGAAPGTRETDLCQPENTVDKAHAVVLSGGSAFGLASATGVMEYLEKQEIGVDMGVCHVPIVPAAVVFDLLVGDGHVRPDAAMGMKACENASAEIRQGAAGAGTGATVGKMIPGVVPARGGVGTASMKLPGGITIGAIVVVNACGDVYDLEGKLIGAGRLPDGTVLPVESVLYNAPPAGREGQNTTIGVIATDAALTKAQAKRLATCAHDGLARTIRPVHTIMDGDTIFALATGKETGEANLFQLCAAASEVMARAVVNAVAMGAEE